MLINYKPFQIAGQAEFLDKATSAQVLPQCRVSSQPQF